MSEQIVSKEERIRLAKRFADKVLEKYGKIVKSIVLMGSVVRGEFKPTSDIDIFVIIDDITVELTPELLEKIDRDLEEIGREISSLISVQPSYSLTEFIDYVRVGHPIIYNFLKEGVAIYDVGFFEPWKKLLLAGKISGTREAIEKYMEDAPKKLERAKTVKLLMLAEDCYYAILNTAQAVLMFLGLPPPSPSKCYEEFKKYLVEPGIVEEELAKYINEIVSIRKKIEQKELLNVSGSFVDEWIEKSEKFVKKMFEILTALEFKKLEKITERTYEVMIKAIATAINSIKNITNEKIEDMDISKIEGLIKEKLNDNIENVFKKEIVEKGLVKGEWWEVWNRVVNSKKIVEEGKIHKLSPREVYENRELVRKLIRELSKIVEKEKS